MIKAIPMEDWLRGCIYHDGRHGYVTLPIDKVHQIANYIQRTRRSVTDGLIDLDVVRKTENSSEKPNNSKEKERVDDCEEMRHMRSRNAYNNSTIQGYIRWVALHERERYMYRLLQKNS